jgi:uncharacterized HAD superfamily protein
MEAIAYGVQARFEETTGYSKRVTDTTINVARALGIPESEINQWAAQRAAQLAQDTEIFQDIKSIMEKVYGTALARQNPACPAQDTT